MVIVDLLKLTAQLRKQTRAGRLSISISAADIAEGYRAMCANAPRRKQAFLSTKRRGVAPIDLSGRRLEERLAMALSNLDEINFESGRRLRLLDYQFPLKSVRGDHGIGKVDLLGLTDEGRLAVVELKVPSNREDRRIGLLEGLIYAAIVEANLKEIAIEVTAMHGNQVQPLRPEILILAPPTFWSAPSCWPTVADLSRLTTEVAAVIPINISLLNLYGLENIDLGLDGTAPSLSGSVFMSSVRVLGRE